MTKMSKESKSSAILKLEGTVGKLEVVFALLAATADVHVDVLAVDDDAVVDVDAGVVGAVDAVLESALAPFVLVPKLLGMGMRSSSVAEATVLWLEPVTFCQTKPHSWAPRICGNAHQSPSHTSISILHLNLNKFKLQ